MNPCPCGNFNTDKKCNCTMGEIARHNSKIDPAMLDRFSMKINVNPIKEIYKNSELTNDIVKIKNMISQARFMQEKRYNNTNKCNSNLLAHEISEYIAINEEISEILTKISSKYNFSRRKYDNILKISRTIADINGNIDIEKNDIFEAIHYA